MADIFTPEQKESLQGTVSTIGEILKSRFQAKELEIFSSNELARFQAESAAFNESIGTFQDPSSNELANSFRQYQTNIFIPFITQASMKHSDNPRIMQVVQQIKQANDDGLKNFMGMAELGLKGRQVATEEKQESRLAAGQQASEARAEQMAPLQREQTEAQTGLIKAQTQYYQGKAGQENQPTTFADVLQQERNPKNYQEKFRVDARTMQSISSRVVAKNRGQLYPSKSGLWGSDPEADMSNALDSLRQKGILQDVYTAGRIQARMGDTTDVAQNLLNAGIDPEAVSLVFSNVPIIEQPETALRGKIDDKVPDRDVVSVITGTPQSTQFQVNDLNEYFDDYVSQMKSYNDLPPQLRQIFDIIKTDKLGNAVVEAGDPETGRLKTVPLSSASEFKELLQTAAKSLIINQTVEQGSKKEKEVKQFLDKVIDKYMPQVMVDKSASIKEQVGLMPQGFLQMLRNEGIEFPHPIDWTEAQVKKGISLFKKGAKKAKLLYEQSGE